VGLSTLKPNVSNERDNHSSAEPQPWASASWLSSKRKKKRLYGRIKQQFLESIQQFQTPVVAPDAPMMLDNSNLDVA
jgi:hypothetical protein